MSQFINPPASPSSSPLSPELVLLPTGTVRLPAEADVKSMTVFGPNDSLTGTLEPLGDIDGRIETDGYSNSWALSGNLRSLTRLLLWQNGINEGVQGITNAPNLVDFAYVAESVYSQYTDNILDQFITNGKTTGTMYLPNQHPTKPSSLDDGTYEYEAYSQWSGYGYGYAMIPVFVNDRPVWNNTSVGYVVWHFNKWVIADVMQPESNQITFEGPSTTSPAGEYIGVEGSAYEGQTRTLTGGTDWEDSGYGKMLTLLNRNWTVYF